MSNIRLNSDPERALKEIEDHLTKLYRALATDTKDKRNDDQKLRVSQGEDGEWKIEIKTNKGWIESDSSSATGFKLKED